METNVTIRLFTEDNNELDCAPIVLSATTKVSQLEQLYHQLAGKLRNEIDEELYFPINFRTKGDQDAWIEIVDSLADSLPENILFSEKPIDLFCLPQAVFYVRPVTRCSASLPGHGEPIISVKFSPNGSSLASGSGDKTVRIWDLQTQLPMKKLEGHKHWVLCIEWSPDGKKLASACKEGIIFIWDTEFTDQNGRKLEGHKQWINALSWQPLNIQPNSRLLASAGRDATIRIWDTTTYNVLRILTGHKASITAIRWGGNDLIYSGSQDRTIKVWRAGDGVLCRSLDGHAHWINTLALNVDYALRTGFYSPSQKKKDDISSDFNVKLNYYKKKYEETLNSQTERLVSGSDDFTMYLWEPALKKQPIARLTGHQQLINHVQFSPDTRLIASASFDKSIKLWDGKTGKFLSTFRGHVSPVYQISWSADSRLLVSGSADSTLKVWNAQKAKLLIELPGHGDEVFAVDWSPNGEQVASGGKDRILKLWKC